MGFLDSVEKVINEHGSAVILKERIALLNEQHADVERKLKVSEAEVARLTAKNGALENELATLRIVNSKAPNDRMPEDRERVLKVVCFNPNLEAGQIAGMSTLEPQVAQWHLDELQQARLIAVSYNSGYGFAADTTTWNVEVKGRGYLARHGLLQ